jgi:hypothetical protein
VTRFLSSESFHWSRRYADRHGCDLTVPNGFGLGDVLVFTRLVDDLGRRKGRGLKLLTSGLTLDYDLQPGEDPLAIWANNPFVKAIVDADAHDPLIMRRARREKDNFPHFDHVIRGIGAAYKMPASTIKPAIYLTKSEMKWALTTLAAFRRPLLCIHRGGTIQPVGAGIRERLWTQVIERLHDQFGLFQVGRPDVDGGRPGPQMQISSIRQMFSLIWAADGFVGFDSGPTHVAAAFGRPSIILWDAVGRTPLEESKEPGFAFTNLVRWSYPQNENIVVFERFLDEAMQRLMVAVKRLVPC